MLKRTLKQLVSYRKVVIITSNQTIGHVVLQCRCVLVTASLPHTSSSSSSSSSPPPHTHTTSHTHTQRTDFNRPSYHYHPHGRVAGEGRRVVAPPCPRSTARLQSDGWNRFVADRATCSVDDQVGDATCGQEVG